MNLTITSLWSEANGGEAVQTFIDALQFALFNLLTNYPKPTFTTQHPQTANREEGEGHQCPKRLLPLPRWQNNKSRAVEQAVEMAMAVEVLVSLLLRPRGKLKLIIFCMLFIT